MNKLDQALRNIEDHLFPSVNPTVHERLVYYHLLRHTRVVGKQKAIFAMAPVGASMGISESTVREAVRRLDSLGCIRIEDRSRRGHVIRVLLPEEIEGMVPEAEASPEVDIESIDFFTERRLVRQLLEREAGRCFYCLKTVTPESCELDHVVPRAAMGSNGYRNIVCSCHDCNSTKQESTAEDFLRGLYRRSILSQSELAERLDALEELLAGNLRPEL